MEKFVLLLLFSLVVVSLSAPLQRHQVALIDELLGEAASTYQDKKGDGKYIQGIQEGNEEVLMQDSELGRQLFETCVEHARQQDTSSDIIGNIDQNLLLYYIAKDHLAQKQLQGPEQKPVLMQEDDFTRSLIADLLAAFANNLSPRVFKLQGGSGNTLLSELMKCWYVSILEHKLQRPEGEQVINNDLRRKVIQIGVNLLDYWIQTHADNKYLNRTFSIIRNLLQDLFLSGEDGVQDTTRGKEFLGSLFDVIKDLARNLQQRNISSDDDNAARIRRQIIILLNNFIQENWQPPQEVASEENISDLVSILPVSTNTPKEGMKKRARIRLLTDPSSKIQTIDFDTFISALNDLGQELLQPLKEAEDKSDRLYGNFLSQALNLITVGLKNPKQDWLENEDYKRNLTKFVDLFREWVMSVSDHAQPQRRDEAVRNSHLTSNLARKMQLLEHKMALVQEGNSELGKNLLGILFSLLDNTMRGGSSDSHFGRQLFNLLSDLIKRHPEKSTFMQQPRSLSMSLIPDSPPYHTKHEAEEIVLEQGFPQLISSMIEKEC